MNRLTKNVLETALEAEMVFTAAGFVLPVIFVDALAIMIRGGQVVNKPFYVVVGVITNGERDILGLWAGDDGGEGTRFWLQIFAELKNRAVTDMLIAVCDGSKDFRRRSPQRGNTRTCSNAWST